MYDQNFTIRITKTKASNFFLAVVSNILGCFNIILGCLVAYYYNECYKNRS